MGMMMIELVLVLLVFVSMVISVGVYAYLVQTKKIEPYIPPRYMRHGGFEIKYTDEDYKRFDKKYEEQKEDDTIRRKS